MRGDKLVHVEENTAVPTRKRSADLMARPSAGNRPDAGWREETAEETMFIRAGPEMNIGE